MKPNSAMNSLLLLSTVLFTPSLALAQGGASEGAQQPTAAVDEADAGEGEEIVVRGRFIPTPQRETSEVAAFLSAEDLARQGDDTASDSLARLTGLSVVSGRFVFVRGLGDRYSSALLNGSPLPSPEPLRRTVPLDLFPSNILSGAVVQKTFSPNYPGEFGGGVIDLRTLRQPNETFADIKVSVGVNTEATSRNGVFVRGSDSDWTGYDDGLRDIPGALSQALGTGGRIGEGNFDDDQLETIGESFVNSPLTVLQFGELGPNWEVEVNGGTSIDFGGFNLGLVGVAGYDVAWRTERATRQLVGQQPVVVGRDLDVTTTNLDSTLNTLGSVSLGFGAHEIATTLFYVHNTSKEAQFGEGLDRNATGAGLVREEGSGWFERELATLQFSGAHEFGALEVDWRGALSRSTRDAPYERSVQFQRDSNGVLGYRESNRNQTRFSELTDEVVSAGVDLTYTLPITEQRDAVFSVGYDYANTVREYELIAFLFTGGANLPEDVATARVDFLFSPDNIEPNRFVLLETTGNDDAYKGGLLVNAAYAMADVELIPLVRAALGVRYEEARQTVRTFNRFALPSTAPAGLENEYLLPAATLTWNFAEDLQFRVGYSQTIARPQFRELAASQYIDPDTDRVYRGNPFLEDSELTNIDARLEYYFGSNRFVTAGVFYKDIDKPIEEVQNEVSFFNYETNFINAPKAVILGFEAELRTTFDMPIDHPLLNDKTWFFSANYTFTDSEVQAGEGDEIRNPFNNGDAQPAADFAIDGKQLQGQAENILNTQFGYQTDSATLTLLLGWVDERVLQRGFGAGLPDVVEDPGVNLDLVYRRDFEVRGKRFTLGLSGRNLLGEAHAEFQESDLGRTEFNTYDRGRSFSASLAAKF